MRYVVTGGCGFIGSEFVRQVLREEPEATVTVLDRLTYAGDEARLSECDPLRGERLGVFRVDVADPGQLDAFLYDDWPADVVVHFAAESHVDRAIASPQNFLTTNVLGTYHLLEAARRVGARFVQVSTDEVYGETFDWAGEDTPLAPRNPYAASKAAAEHLVQSYHLTYGLDTVITRGSNTYGPWQYPEKLIPRMLCRVLSGQAPALYGSGRQARDWLHVADHAAGVRVAARSGLAGCAYNITAECRWENRDVAERVLKLLGREDLGIQYVPDRPGHDACYSISAYALELHGWKPRYPFPDGLEKTVQWYREHEAWWRPKWAESEQFYRELGR